MANLTKKQNELVEVLQNIFVIAEKEKNDYQRCVVICEKQDEFYTFPAGMTYELLTKYIVACLIQKKPTKIIVDFKEQFKNRKCKKLQSIQPEEHKNSICITSLNK